MFFVVKYNQAKKIGMRINPSTPGWVSKFLNSIADFHEFECYDDLYFYLKRRETGFIYGHIISFDSKFAFVTNDLSIDEKSKIALLNILFKLYLLRTEKKNHEEFIEEIVAFYSQLAPAKTHFFSRFFSGKSKQEQLEKLIDNRIQTNHNFIGKNFTNILTNTLLFMDVLAFDFFLKGNNQVQEYITQLETNVLMVASAALNAKSNKTKHEHLISKMFESSVRYSKFDAFSRKRALDYSLFKNHTLLEKLYLIDLATMCVYSDDFREPNETSFIKNMGEHFSLTENLVNETLNSVENFIHKYKHEIPYFNASNPIKNFYNQSTSTVLKLLQRNKRRILQEALQSKQLVVLLAQSTQRDLTVKEKKIVKNQVLDICKTIPSLTIFLLPGGSLLLPILIKFIPTLLPSAFNENLQNDQ